MEEVKSNQGEADKHEQCFQQWRSFLEEHLEQHGGDFCLRCLAGLLVNHLLKQSDYSSGTSPGIHND